jgi:hypothetical protein
MPDDALLEIGKSAGIGEGQALAWKARIAKATKISDQMAALEIKKINSEIAENYAQTAKSNKETSKLDRKASEGFFDKDIEDDVRGDATSLKDAVAKGTITETQGLQQLRTLYSQDDVTDEALLKVWGVQSVGSEDIDQKEQANIPGSFGSINIFDELSGLIDKGPLERKKADIQNKQDRANSVKKQFDYYKAQSKLRELTQNEQNIVWNLRDQAKQLGITL